LSFGYIKDLGGCVMEKVYNFFSKSYETEIASFYVIHFLVFLD